MLGLIRIFCVLAISLLGTAIGGPVWSAEPEPPGVPSKSLPPEIHAVTVGGVTAHFGGEKPAGDMPLRFGVSALWFTFGNDTTPHVFRPAGQLYFSDWRFDLFSRDGLHVLLLQDRFGPYHIVAAARLKDYLAGRVGPDHVATKAKAPDEPAGVHEGGHWVSAQEVRFTVTCCGVGKTITYRLP